MTNLNDLFESKFPITGTRMPNGNYSSWTDQIKFDVFREVLLMQQAEVREKDKRIKALAKRLNEALSIIVDDLECILGGAEEYRKTRDQAEQHMKNGARITQHRIDL